MDEEGIKRKVWEGRIPVCFTVAEEELGHNFSDVAVPEPCYMLIPRVSYFPLVYDKLEKLYGRAAKQEPSDEIWLSSEAVALKWQYPVGVLYDLYGRGGQLPWTVTVHFKDFPEEVLLHCQGKDAVEAHFKSKIKEADCLKHRSEITQSLTPQDFSKLWDGFRHNNFDDFWSVNKKFMLNTRSMKETFKSIPFCIYRDGQPVFQRLLCPSEGNSTLTLADLVKLYCSHYDLPSDHTSLIHGIELSPTTPLQWLSEHFSHPDNFLHMCVVPRGTYT